MLNLPNLISLLRFVLAPVFLVIFWSPYPNRMAFGMGILALAGITDMLDGYLARKLNMVTATGKMLDPLADKAVVISVLISLYLIGKIPFWLVALIMIKESMIVIGSLYLLLNNRAGVNVSISGKASTVTIYAAFFVAAFSLSSSTIMVAIAGIVSIAALIGYVNAFIRVSVR